MTDASSRLTVRRLALLLVRLLAAVSLLALAAWAVGLEALIEQLRRVDPLRLALAVVALVAAQWISAARWILIARVLGLRFPAPQLRLAYAQAMAINVVLPGATLGGDALRSVRLQRLGNPLGESALSVLLDRASGLWILCLLSLCTGVGLMLTGQLDRLHLPGAAARLDPRSIGWIYVGALSAAVALPFAPLRVPGAAGVAPGRLARLLARLAQLHQLTIARARPLARSLWTSLLVQVLCAISLWQCQLAAGGTAGYLAIQAIAAPVFVAGVVPLSYGGFGARELAALLVFPLIGVDPRIGVAAGALYGVSTVLLGLAAAPLLATSPLLSPVQTGRQGPT